MFRRFVIPSAILGVILLVGTIGYFIIGGGNSSVVDSLYMTVITVATIGYGEIIDLSANPGGRVFTMAIAFTGIGVLAYIMSSFTAFIVEGELTRAFRRRKMEHQAQALKGHYIVCGMGLVGANVIQELRATKRPFVVIENPQENNEPNREFPNSTIMIEGDATDAVVLQKAGIDSAAGLFAVSADDNLNLVICLTAKQLNGNLRVVSQCNDIKNSDKLRRAGADAVVSPGYIGGLRMASEMVRPNVVTFLDTMLRDSKASLRVEEVEVPTSLAGKNLGDLNLKRFRNALLLAVTNKNGWVYNPGDDYRLTSGDVLVVMTDIADRIELSKLFQPTSN